MMQFRTVLKAQKASFDIGYSDHILGIGSCFVDNIGQRLSDLKFSTLLNPFGIVYNPISIFKNIEMLLSETPFQEDDIFEQNGLWHSWQHHSQFSHFGKEETLLNINNAFLNAQAFLKKTNRLIITLGTAHAYSLKSTGKIVANCHKVPSQYFDKNLLSVGEIVKKFDKMFSVLTAQNTDIQIIMTVSPIRHIRDGIIENQKSKAILIVAIDEICQKYPNVHYFPSYEIMMDDLRDYRFYEADMIHPNGQAIDYIWQFFNETYFNTSTQHIVEEVHKLNLMRNHRPLHPDTEGYQKFAQALEEKTQAFLKKYPFIEF